MVKCDANPQCKALEKSFSSHKCDRCGKSVHAVFCSTPHDELDDRLKTYFKPYCDKANNNYHDICFPCIENAKKELRTSSASTTASRTPTTSTASSSTSKTTTATKTTSTAPAADVLAAAAAPTGYRKTGKNEREEGVIDLTGPLKKKSKKQAVLKFGDIQPKPPKKKASSSSNPTARAPRKQYDMKFKLQVLRFLEVPGNTVAAAEMQFKVSKQCISNWKLQKSAIEAACELNPKAKRVVKNDPLLRIKIGIIAFYELNKSMPNDAKLPITGEYAM